MKQTPLWHGVLPLWKPEGMTSHDCVARARRLFRQKQIGHAGTLDPAVCGVLPLLLGKATRIADYVHALPKTYQATVCIGAATDTEDATGQRTAVVDEVKLTYADVLSATHAFVGTYQQMAPLYAAVHVQGKRLYEWARSGMNVERPVREVIIHQLKVIGVDLDRKHPTMDVYVVCSKGTYIRTLCVDIGARLGYPAHMAQLQRIACCGIDRAECVSWETLERSQIDESAQTHLWSIDRALSFMPTCTVSLDVALKLTYGQPVGGQQCFPPCPVGIPVRLVSGKQTIAIVMRESETTSLRIRCLFVSPEDVRVQLGRI